MGGPSDNRLLSQAQGASPVDAAMPLTATVWLRSNISPDLNIARMVTASFRVREGAWRQFDAIGIGARVTGTYLIYKLQTTGFAV